MKTIFTEKNIFTFMVCVFALFSMFYGYIRYHEYWLENVDAVTENPIITYTQNVNPLALEPLEKIYHPGDLVQFYTSYCKNRRAKAKAGWYLVNDKTYQKTWFDDGKWKEGILGCTPPDQKNGMYAIADAVSIPANSLYGSFHFEGVVTRVLPDGRTREEDLKTLSFIIGPK